MDWSDIVKGLITALLIWVGTRISKKISPLIIVIGKYFKIVARTDEIWSYVKILQSERIADYHTSYDPVIIKNAKGEVKYANPAFVDMAGFNNAAEVCGFGYTTAIHPDYEEIENKRMELQIAHPSEMSGYMDFKNKKTGAKVHCFYRTQLVFGGKKELVETIIRLYIEK